MPEGDIHCISARLQRLLRIVRICAPGIIRLPASILPGYGKGCGTGLVSGSGLAYGLSCNNDLSLQNGRIVRPDDASVRWVEGLAAEIILESQPVISAVQRASLRSGHRHGPFFFLRGYGNFVRLDVVGSLIQRAHGHGGTETT